MQNINENIYGSRFDKETLERLKKIDEAVMNEEKTDNPDSQEIYRLRLAKRLQGLGTAGLSGRGYRTMYPY